MSDKSKPWNNESGYHDPTSYEALKPIITEDNYIERTAHNLVNTCKFIAEWAGFEFIGRIQIRHKKSGREFK